MHIYACMCCAVHGLCRWYVSMARVVPTPMLFAINSIIVDDNADIFSFHSDKWLDLLYEPSYTKSYTYPSHQARDILQYLFSRTSLSWFSQKHIDWTPSSVQQHTIYSRTKAQTMRWHRWVYRWLQNYNRWENRDEVTQKSVSKNIHPSQSQDYHTATLPTKLHHSRTITDNCICGSNIVAHHDMPSIAYAG